jgi:lactate dehydrogenase-like 2-hydroxyacid dehydrogenase
MRIVFCGNTFPDATEYLRRALPQGITDELIVWPGNDLQNMPRDSDVLIPKIHRVDASVMDASGARLIQQWGAGLEGIDLEAAKARGIALANLPASGVNANSVAEHHILSSSAFSSAALDCFACKSAGVRMWT